MGQLSLASSMPSPSVSLPIEQERVWPGLRAPGVEEALGQFVQIEDVVPDLLGIRSQWGSCRVQSARIR